MELVIRKKVETPRKSSDYEFLIDGNPLPKRTTNVILEMGADRKPKLTIECYPEQIDVIVSNVETILKN